MLVEYTPVRPALRTLTSRLARVRVLIVDEDWQIAQLVKDVLRVVGFTNVHIMPNTTQAIEVMKEYTVDLLIIDWNIEPMNGVSFLEFMRSSPDSPNRFVPVIMLTGKAEMDDVKTARDAGVTEYLVKPFSARTLFERIVQVIENPRSFILAHGYKGPDRRRKEKGTQGDERRKRKIKAISRAAVSDQVNQTKTNAPYGNEVS